MSNTSQSTKMSNTKKATPVAAAPVAAAPVATPVAKSVKKASPAATKSAAKSAEKPVEVAVTKPAETDAKPAKAAKKASSAAKSVEKPVEAKPVEAAAPGKKKKTSDAGGASKKKKTSAGAAPVAVETATDATATATDVESGPESARKRTFKICRENGEFSSRLIGKTPKQAANKALTALFREAIRTGAYKGDAGGFKADFTIRETTRRSNGKEYSYSGMREKLSQPTVYRIVVGEEVKEIVNNYRNSVMKVQPAAV